MPRGSVLVPGRRPAAGVRRAGTGHRVWDVDGTSTSTFTTASGHGRRHATKIVDAVSKRIAQDPFRPAVWSCEVARELSRASAAAVALHHSGRSPRSTRCGSPGVHRAIG